MILSLFAVGVALALPPGPPPDTGRAPAASANQLLDEKITLSLKEADLGQVLDRLATLLGKTLILQPGIGGRVTLEIRETKVADVLAALEADHGLTVKLEGDRMYVTRAAEKAPAGAGNPDADTLDRAFLADDALPRRPASETPPQFEGAFGFRGEAGARAAAWDIGGSLGTLALPGCSSEVAAVRLPGDLFDGVPRVALAPAGARLARIVAPGGNVRLPDCAGSFTLEALTSPEGASTPAPAARGGVLRLGVEVLEASAGGDEVLAAPHLRLAAGEVGTMQSGSRRPGGAGGQTIHMSFAVLDAGTADALVACSISVTRDVAPAPGSPLVTIRVARADESLRLEYGKPARVNVSPTYGRGLSSLVLALTLERLAR
jgi:hypothetical protein